ncbi:uncharacterized protein BDV14DRAFT_202369 [Aspergillus stella-maris]|uniref:uncharacterized protein n=1 Tax=Aspergillus stella-maris TaxID=1810926 RepID=UPI003CCDDF62
MSLEALPEELIALTLRNCDSFSTLQNLIQLSKSIHDVWELNQRSILWEVGQAAIPAFTDALIAVRATNIAKESVLNGHLPPTKFPISTLGGETNKPTLDETKSVLYLAKLANYLESRTRCPKNKERGFLPHKWYFHSLAWSSQTWAIWRENYHRAVYRYFTAGAVLCRTYHEPLVSESRPKDFLSSLTGILGGISSRIRGRNTDPASPSEYPVWYTEEEKRYMSTIPIYDSQEYKQWGDAFGLLEELFVQEAMKRSHNKPPSSHKPSKSEWLGKTLYGAFGSKAKNPFSLDASHSETLFTDIIGLLHMIDGDIRSLILLPGDTPAENTSHAISHSLQLFPFGSFTLMDIRIRKSTNPLSSTTESSAAYATPTPLPPPTSSNGSSLSFSAMHNHLKKIQDCSGLPNCYFSDPLLKTAPPSSFFVEYMLRKYFSLRFAVDMFDATVEVRAAWFAFHQYAGVFSGFVPLCPGCGYVGCNMLSEDIGRVWPVPVYNEDAWYY